MSGTSWGIFTLSFLLTLGTCLAAPAAVWYVDRDATGAEDGTSWTTAFRTVQSGIDAACADGGGEVWVAEGVYNELRMSYPGGVSESTGSIMMIGGVHVYGGFAGVESERDERDYVLHVTTLDGTTSRSGEPAYHVVVGADDSTLDGFTVTGGAGHACGGGMYNEGASPTVANCTFTGNSSQHVGGAMYNRRSSPTVVDCIFDGNSTWNEGGGIYNTESSPTIIRCALNGNICNGSAGSRGGGIYSDSSSPTVANCTFRGNDGKSAGGGIFNASSVAIITNCTFVGNLARGAIPGCGGGTYNQDSTLKVDSCTFEANASAIGSSMYNATSSLEVTNCAFRNNVGNCIRNAISSLTVTNCIFNGCCSIITAFTRRIVSCTHSRIHPIGWT